ncbi:autotransporter outer membrane beta-barrel domain-containing protein, partial [Escherichia coli]|uniref:autotransporter outer membrane beta-barrel domain-containing protein n=1 Tax=Escherichia coli TaxID=562 RepID=UPI00201B5707
NQESRLPPGSDFRRWVWITIAPFVTLYTGLIFTHTSTNAELSGSYYGDTKSYGLGGYTSIFFDNGFYTEPPRVSWRVFYL